jgi:hypothetical protein
MADLVMLDRGETAIDFSWTQPSGAAIAAAGYRCVLGYLPWQPTGRESGCLYPAMIADLLANGVCWSGIWELSATRALDENDEKHMCPLQLDVIERCIHLWTNKGDLVFSPFTGIGSEGYSAVRMGRRFVGTELKPQYFELACLNIEDATKEQHGLFEQIKEAA